MYELCMYVIRVGLRVRADALPQFVQHAQEEAAEVPQRFAGCLRYGFFAQLGDPSAFLLYEEWRDRESFEAYRHSDYFGEIGQRVRPLLDGRPDGAYFVAEPASTAVA